MGTVLHETAEGLAVIRFLMLTGVRRMEALTLRWGQVDFAAQCLRLADTKSGPQTRPIGKSAIELLEAHKPKKAKDGDYVFAGTGKAGHFVGAPKAWVRVAKRAKVNGVSLHGLRHWFASAAAEMNYSELTIAGLLGHSVRSVTGRYATTPDSALIAAADDVSMRIEVALQQDA
jgi:integrase